MDRLPPEMLCHLLHYLSLNEQLNLSLTCKRLRWFFSDLPAKKLAVFIKDHPFFYRLADSDEEIGYRNSLRLMDTRGFRSFAFRSRFARIRKLVVVYDDWDRGNKLYHLSIDVEDLNCFGDVEQLELKIGRLTMRSDRTALSLNKLRTCLIYTRHPSEFAIQSIHLSTLSIGGQALPRIKPFDFVSFQLFACLNNYSSNKQKNFKPISEFATDGITSLSFNGSIEHLKKLFQELTSLVSLTLNSYQLAGQFMAFAPTHASFKEVRITERLFERGELISLLAYKRIYGVPFDIYFYDLNLESEHFLEMCNAIKDVRALSVIDKTNYRVFANHRAYFDAMLPFVKVLDLANFELNQEFIRKLRSVDTLKIAGGLADVTFRTMLETFKQLKSLSLNSGGCISQQSARSIANRFLNLRHLEVKNCKFSDFTFIVELSNLCSLILDSEVGTRGLTFILNNRPAALSSISIVHQNEQFQISFANPTKFVVQKNFNQLSFYKSPNLVRFIFSNQTEG